MRLLYEVIGSGQDVANFPKKGGGVENVPFVWISGVDSDYMDQLIRIKVYKPANAERLKQMACKGARLQIRFANIKNNDFEKCLVINAKEQDISIYMSRAEKPEQSDRPLMAVGE